MRRHLRDRSALIRVPRRDQRRARGSAGRNDARRGCSAARHSGARRGRGTDGLRVRGCAHVERARSPLTLADDAAQPLTAEDVFHPSEDRVAVAIGLGRLHWREREAVRYRYFADMSRAEIARRLGSHRPSTSRLLASGLTKLRGDLDANAEFFAFQRAKLVAWRLQTPSRARRLRERPKPRQRGGTHSGRLLLRMPRSLHEELARASDRDGVSLNQFITACWRRRSTGAAR